MSAASVPGLANERITAPTTSLPFGSIRAAVRSSSTSGQRGADSSAAHTADGGALVENVRVMVIELGISLRPESAGNGRTAHGRRLYQLKTASHRFDSSGIPGFVTWRFAWSCAVDGTVEFHCGC